MNCPPLPDFPTPATPLQEEEDWCGKWNRQTALLTCWSAYRVIVKLCVALLHPERAFQYLSRLKEAGFIPTSDICSNLIEGYVVEGRMTKCWWLIRDAESTDVMLDKRLVSSFTSLNHCQSKLSHKE